MVEVVDVVGAGAGAGKFYLSLFNCYSWDLGLLTLSADAVEDDDRSQRRMEKGEGRGHWISVLGVTVLVSGWRAKLLFLFCGFLWDII